MTPGVVVPALGPTARALSWWPTLGVGFGLLAAQAVAGTAQPPAALTVLAAGALATAAIAALHDPADDLLAAVPTGRGARRMLRLALLAVVVAPVAMLLAALGARPAPAPSVLALSVTGLAVATWLPPRYLPAAVAVPAGWLASVLLLDNLPSHLHEASTVWITHPWQVTLAAGLAIALGRNR